MEFVQNLCMYPTTIKDVGTLILLGLVFSVFISLSWFIIFLPGKTVVDVLKFSFIVSLLGTFEPLLYMSNKYFLIKFLCYHDKIWYKKINYEKIFIIFEQLSFKFYI